MFELMKRWWTNLKNDKGIYELAREVDALAEKLKNSNQNNK